MPGSPKIWGTPELEKQGDGWLQRPLQASAHAYPDPREGRSGGQP